MVISCVVGNNIVNQKVISMTTNKTVRCMEMSLSCKCFEFWKKYFRPLKKTLNDLLIEFQSLLHVAHGKANLNELMK